MLTYAGGEELGLSTDVPRGKPTPVAIFSGFIIHQHTHTEGREGEGDREREKGRQRERERQRDRETERQRDIHSDHSSRMEHVVAPLTRD
jgi:hypothetical protein